MRCIRDGITNPRMSDGSTFLNNSMRNIISLVEETQKHLRVWRATDKELAKEIIDNGIKFAHGRFGYGFYCDGDIPQSGEDIVLEFTVNEDYHILDLHDEHDQAIWHDGHYRRKIHDDKLWKLLVHRGIDGLCDGSEYCFYNPEAVDFSRVYSGVVGDPLEETDTAELDEIALGGLKRCTAVTVNALLNIFHKPGITLSEVPINNPGVLHLLDIKGLAYRPHPEDAGRSVQQFMAIHRIGDWYLLTPGHAMALVKGQLFDAENKGPDQRKLIAAFEITRR